MTVPGRISVVLPNYNHARLLPRALEALAAQSRAAAEVLLIDDASTDNSVEVATAFLPRLAGLRILRQPRNGGVVAALQRGLAEAKGEYVYLAASDDESRPALFARAAGALDAQPGAAIAAGEALLIGPHGQRAGLRPAILPRRAEGFVSPADTAALLRRADHLVVSVAALWRRAPMLEAGGLDASLGAMCDYFLARELALRHGFVFIPEVLGVWHVSPGGVSRSVAARPQAMLDLVARARAMMEARIGDPYPAWYPPLFERRARFAAARVLVTEPAGPVPDATLIAAMSGSGAAERAAMRLATRLPGAAARIAALGLLTVRHRPMSIMALLGSQLDRRLRPRRETG
jgi:glycosyltransferase involved in cell wall biosynthesis